VNAVLSNLYFIGLLGAALAGSLLFGLLANILLFPSMWQQSDLPRWIRYLAGAQPGRRARRHLERR
jgi:hypothetical protein